MTDVTRSWWASRRGKVKLGCLFTLLLCAVGFYYGMDPGEAYFKSWRIQQEMRTQAGFAAGIDDVTIRQRLINKIDALDLPAEAKRNLRIRRRARPREITISTSYVVQLRRPFAEPIAWTLRPEARQALGAF